MFNSQPDMPCSYKDAGVCIGIFDIERLGPWACEWYQRSCFSGVDNADMQKASKKKTVHCTNLYRLHSGVSVGAVETQGSSHCAEGLYSWPLGERHNKAYIHGWGTSYLSSGCVLFFIKFFNVCTYKCNSNYKTRTYLHLGNFGSTAILNSRINWTS